MEQFIYKKSFINIMTLALTIAFFVIPGVLVGWELVLILSALVAFGGLTRGRIHPLNFTGVREATFSYHSGLLNLVRQLSLKAGLDSVPQVYISDRNGNNAAALMGSDGPAIIVGAGLLNSLPYDEIEAVLAHEISHISNGDLLLLGILTQFRSLLSFIPKLFVGALFFIPFLLFLIPFSTGIIGLGVTALIAVFIERAIMRLREYGADYQAAQLIDNPMNLARALRRIETEPVYVRWFGRTVMVPQRRPTDEQGIGSLLRSHPSTESRIRFLRRISGRGKRIIFPGAGRFAG